MVAKQSFAILLMITVASAADIPNRLIDYDKFQVEVGEVRGQVVDGEVAHFQVTLKIGFRVDD